jgi:FMN phosphatase YigB (HAD superfamily)
MSDKPKALLFDVFGTLVDWRTSIARESEQVLKPLGVAVDWLAFADAWRGEYQGAMDQVRDGHILQARRAAPAQSRSHHAAFQHFGHCRERAAVSQSGLASTRRMA